MSEAKPKKRLKRWPQEERLMIREDPVAALARLLKPTTAPKPGK